MGGGNLIRATDIGRPFKLETSQPEVNHEQENAASQKAFWRIQYRDFSAGQQNRRDRCYGV
jgi:hypothetical protein